MRCGSVLASRWDKSGETMAGHKLITAPSVEPVLIADVKTQTGLVTADGLDTVITRRIIEARQYVEQYCGRALITQTWELALDAFDGDEIELPLASAASITSIKYMDTNNVEQTLSASSYTLNDYTQPGVIHLNSGYAWPSIYDVVNAVKVRYVSGYGASGSYVPGPINEAIMLIVGHWMHFQPGVESGVTITRIPLAALDLLAPYRILRV